MERMLERIERKKNRKLATVTIEITVRVIKNMNKLEESEIIKNNRKTKMIKKLYKEPGIERLTRSIELNELAKCLNINLRIESKKTILSIAEYISNGKTSKIEPLDFSLKNKCIAFFPELTFGILSSCNNYRKIIFQKLIQEKKLCVCF